MQKHGSVAYYHSDARIERSQTERRAGRQAGFAASKATLRSLTWRRRWRRRWAWHWRCRHPSHLHRTRDLVTSLRARCRLEACSIRSEYALTSTQSDELLEVDFVIAWHT
jgi:hypothetical protein